MKSLYVHYKNKYPGGSVRMSEESFDVYSATGEHVVALRKNGAGQMLDVSEELGLRDRHCLAPIPKDSRVYKMREGKVAYDEMAAERASKRGAFICPKIRDKILSCVELEKEHGFKFDEKQRSLEMPKAKAE